MHSDFSVYYFLLKVSFKKPLRDDFNKKRNQLLNS